MSGKRHSYTAGFKLQVIAFAENANNSAAAHHFSINEKQVREWRKKQSELADMSKSRKAARGRRPMFNELESKLALWVQESRLNGYIISRTAIRMKALNLSKQPEFANSKPANFVASVGWVSRFMKRNNLCFRSRTKLAQKLPSELESKVESFQQRIIQLRKNYDYELSQIGNMDETPVCFDLPTSRTVDTKGSKTVFVKTTGHEKCRFTVVLCCMADGTRLPPTIIFKRKTLPKKVIFPSGVVVRAHEKGWMDEAGTVEWLEKVWNRRKGAVFNKQSILVWDSFRAHITDSVKEKCKELKTAMAVIPGGLTSMLQPLDVCLNKPFKDRLRAKWIEWMAKGDNPLTAKGNMKKVDIVTVAQWVKESWAEIPSSIIIKSFKKCCISNAMDGTEDDIVYEDDDSCSKSCDDDDDAHTDIHMTENEFRELFGQSDSDSDFEEMQ